MKKRSIIPAGSTVKTLAEIAEIEWRGRLAESRTKLPAQGYTRAWCPQCGPDVAFDEDGCCSICGATATGEGAEAAFAHRLESVSRGTALSAIRSELFDVMLGKEPEHNSPGDDPWWVRAADAVSRIKSEQRVAVAMLKRARGSLRQVVVGDSHSAQPTLEAIEKFLDGKP